MRYPGGKSFLYKYLKNIIEKNRPINTYVEPFAGGAGAALQLLSNKIVKKIILNDIDDLIFKFWKSIFSETNEFINLLNKTPISVEEWEKWNLIVKNKNIREKYSDLEIGFATFYTNRCNRSGILNAGVIGGKEQNGKWKINARFNKKDLIKRIEKLQEMKENISFFNKDAIPFLSEDIIKKNLIKKSIIYLDPPYYKNGPTLYLNYFTDKNHIELNNFLKNFNAKWILSYDDIGFIRELYNGRNLNSFQKNHFANKKKVGKELIIWSDNCKIPNNIIL